MKRRTFLLSLLTLTSTSSSMFTSCSSANKGKKMQPIILHGHNDAIRALSWSHDGEKIATASDDGSVRIWDIAQRKTILKYTGHTSHVEGVSWSPDNTHLVSGSADGTARIWDAKTGATQLIYKGHTVQDFYQKHPWVNRCKWSPDGGRIASCDQTSIDSGNPTLQVWDAKTGHAISVFFGHSNGIYSLAWTPDGKQIASVGYDGRLCISDATTGALINQHSQGGWLFAVDSSPDGKSVALGGTNHALALFSVGDSTLKQIFSTPSSPGYGLRDVAWSPDGKNIAVAVNQQGTRLIDLKGKEVFAYTSQSGDIAAVAWSPDGLYVASGSGGDGGDYSLHIWQPVI